MNENNELQIKMIDYHSKDYSQEQELRNRVLRKPMGMSLYDENLEAEQHDVHIGAYIQGTLAGVLILTKLNTADIKMRQVAVDVAFRGRKTGTELVHFAEEYSKEKGFSTMVLHARKTAVGFYEKLGYETVGEEFLEINIPHFNMRKCL
jgi:predicted GNAT family N-acyltransferase